MKRHFEALRNWFLALEKRERWLVGGAGALLALMLLYAGAIEPFFFAKRNLHQQVAARETDLDWMRQAVPRVQALRGNAPRLENLDGSLLGTVDASARQQGLASAIRTIQQDDNGRAVRIRIEQASFDALVRWLDNLRSRYGITASSISIERSDKTGAINASLTLQQPGV